MSLLLACLLITAAWLCPFPQQRTFHPAVRQALGSLLCLGRRCLTRMIWTNDGWHGSCSAEYLLHSRRQWEPQRLFQPILKSALEFCPRRPVGVTLDDSRRSQEHSGLLRAFNRTPERNLTT
jgi:hypothetical protein